MPVMSQTDTVAIGNEVVTVKQANVNIAAAGTTTVIPAVPGRILRVICLSLNCAGANKITFKSNETALGGSYSMTGNSTLSIDRNLPTYFIQTAEGEALKITTTEVNQVSGSFNYIECY